MSGFIPHITAFCCRQSAARAAASSRLPPEVEVVEVSCSGHVEIREVLAALLDGADGVLILGCHPDNCEHLVGNERARKRMEHLAGLLERIGLDGRRVAFRPVAAVEEPAFVEQIEGMLSVLKELGPTPGR